ncbi:auxin response factor 3 isoform X2 [Malania oleifera]|uniref:auxin response factor 3 isoform X2 n=1 Tax=Malania oleifera TaxID=397392 RepID=UPI0025ADEF8D|nr:auxin response factor 3 isoform X2 [Malania oleifera]
MGGLIDLNTVDGEDEAPSSGSSPSSSSSSVSATVVNYSTHASLASASSSSSSVCLELWHACAGPLISLPKKGSIVVYFPQGHLEQASDFPAAAFDLPPHVFCRVVDVKLHAETASDEVFAQVSLVPENQIEQKLREGEAVGDGDEEDIEGAAKLIMPHMFCKTLTASDTSTHGGFSVPRRAAEDCFPPLDYKQQRPSQELVAKDLHGLEWRFRHIYRGQPRRHLLTTGWSAFVNKKKLVSGDAVLFLRGGDGELRLGIRRAAQVKGDSHFPAPCSQQLNLNSFTAVVNAISMGSVFSIFYNPRASSSEFIIPFRKFSRSLDHSFSVGMRFKMRFETEDAAERRYTGLVTGISDMDLRWPGSKWRCLLVRWDDIEANRHNRVSPWEIEPCGSVCGSNGFMVPGSKRFRDGLPSTKPDFPISNGIGGSDFGESLRFQKVLQGQEILGFNTPYDGFGTHDHPSERRRCFHGSNSAGIAARGNGVSCNLLGASDISCKGIGFGESFRFQKVLQGQETLSNPPYGMASAAIKVCENHGLGILNGVEVPSSREGWPALMWGYDASVHVPARAPLIQASSPSSVLMFQQACTPVLGFHPTNSVDNQKEKAITNRKLADISETYGGNLTPSSSSNICFRRGIEVGTGSCGLLKEHHSAVSSSQNLVSSCKSSCRLFGFPLTEEIGDRGNGENSARITSLNSKVSYLPHVEEQIHTKPPVMSKAVGSSCTKI